MKCPEDNFETENKKSFSNHIRWHLGLMNKESYLGINKSEKNGMWKGDKVGRLSLHEWGRNHKEKPLICEKCKERPPYDLANKSGNYKRDLDDWEWLCRKCHMESDGRLEKFIKIKRKPPIGEINGMSKLKEMDIKKIHELYLKGISQVKIGQIYKVSQSNISWIIKGKGWKYLKERL